MKPELKKLLLLNLPYLLFVYLFAKCGQAYRLAAARGSSAKLLHLTSGISAAFANPLPSLHPFDLCVGVVERWLSGSSCTARARTPRSTARARNTALPDGAPPRTLPPTSTPSLKTTSC